MKLEESNDVEFKEIMNKDINKEIIAFLNTHGGTIYIGITDDGSIIGVPKDKKDYYATQLSNIISDGIKPYARNLISFEYNENNVLVIKIKEGDKKPYYISEKGPKPSGVFIRYGRSSRPTYDEEILSMIMETRKFSFEKEISEEQKLTFNYAKDIANQKEIEFDQRSYLSLGIINKNQKFTNLGLLISDQNPYIIKFAKYDENLNFLKKKEFDGSIIKIADQVLDYAELLNTTSAIIVPYQAQRIEKKSFPGVSLRESILNAICHADYLKPSNIKIEFYDNRVEITNPGGIYDGTLDLILKGYQTFRNPGLVRILALFDYIENYGKGLKRINEAYANKNREVEYDVNNTFFRIILPDLNYNVPQNVPQNFPQNVPQNFPQNVPQKTDIELIIEAIKNNDKIKRYELAKLIGKSTKTVQRIINSNKNIKYVGSSKSGHWVIIDK